MIQSLEANEIDYAFLLTESASKAIGAGSDLIALSIFVESPLQWGIFSSAQNPIQTIEPVEDKKYAISRFGSGSELMAIVDAAQRGGKIQNQNWVLAHNLAGAEKALVSGEADLFFWEKWTTKPLVDKGIFKMMGVCPSPWSSFVLVCRKDESILPNRLKAIQSVFSEVLNLAAKLVLDQRGASKIAEAYHLQEKDAEDWLQSVRWVREWTDPQPELDKASRWFGQK